MFALSARLPRSNIENDHLASSKKVICDLFLSSTKKILLCLEVCQILKFVENGQKEEIQLSDYCAIFAFTSADQRNDTQGRKKETISIRTWQQNWLAVGHCLQDSFVQYLMTPRENLVVRPLLPAQQQKILYRLNSLWLPPI